MTGAEVRQEIGRRATSRDRVLAALLEVGPRGLLNTELCRPEIGGLRAVGRVDELRDEWDIETVRVHRGLFRYVLHGRKEPKQQGLWGAA